MTSENYEIHPFYSVAQYEAMIDYYLLADDVFLRGMGVERNRLPRKDKWLREVLADHEVPDDKKGQVLSLMDLQRSADGPFKY